jgi:hypothetical protein
MTANRFAFAGNTAKARKAYQEFLTQSIALLGLNVVGAILYVVAASYGGWAIPQERAAGIYTTIGEPFIWFLKHSSNSRNLLCDQCRLGSSHSL